MTADNLISAQLTETEQSEVAARIGEIKKAMGFLITLTTQERLRLAKPGSDALAAADSLVSMVERHGKYFSTEVIDPKEMRKDLALIKALTPIHDMLQGLVESVSDTISAAKSDTYRSTLKAYTLAQVIAKQVPGMEASLDPIKEVLDRPSRKKKEKEA